MRCPICDDRGYTTRDHAYYQDGATQYETVEIDCPCSALGDPDGDGPGYDDLDDAPPTRIGSLAVEGEVPDARALDGDLAEVEMYAHHLAVRERDAALVARVARVRAMRGVWS